MAKVKHLKTREVEIDYFHFYGCSLPAGHELNDPKDKVYEGRDMHIRQKKNKQESFPAKLSGLFEVPFSNRAEYGCSVQATKFYFVEDVLRNKIKRNHAVFFCITLPFRFGTFDAEDGTSMSFQYHEAAERFGGPDFLAFHNDYKILYDYLTTLWEVILICKTIGCSLFFIPMFYKPTFTGLKYYPPIDPNLSAEKIRNEWYLRRPLTGIIREIDCHSIDIKPFMQYTHHREEENTTGESYKLPGNHPVQKIHDEYAEMLYSELKIDK